MLNDFYVAHVRDFPVNQLTGCLTIACLLLLTISFPIPYL